MNLLINALIKKIFKKFANYNNKKFNNILIRLYKMNNNANNNCNNRKNLKILFL